MHDEAQRAFDTALTRDLDGLVAEGPPAARATAVARGWDLPADAVGALTRWGVPVLPAGPSGISTLAGDVQTEPEPQLMARGITAYRLASYFGRPIGALPGSGAVYGLPEEEHFPVVLINTSVPAFVEIAWRLHFTTQALIPLDEAEEYEQLEGNLQRFCDWIHELDPGCKPPGAASWWDGIAGSW